MVWGRMARAQPKEERGARKGKRLGEQVGLRGSHGPVVRERKRERNQG